VLTIANGPHAGTQTLNGEDVDCSFGLFKPDQYYVSYSPTAELSTGDLSYVSVGVARSGGKADVSIFFEGDDFEHDFLNANNVSATLVETPTNVHIQSTGRAGGTDFEITFDCGTVDRF
jgi:hypothetical protein